MRRGNTTDSFIFGLLLFVIFAGLGVLAHRAYRSFQEAQQRATAAITAPLTHGPERQ
jgi:uncharacterized membrane protein YebE (DUF533 family)